jgi:hypothetical protein
MRRNSSLKVIGVVLVAITGLTLLLLVLGRRPAKPIYSPQEHVTFLIHVRGTTGLTTFQLTSQQASAFRKIVMGPAIWESSADHQRPMGFFKVGNDTYSWRGRLLSLGPERGGHWNWRDPDRLGKISSEMIDVPTAEQVRTELRWLEDKPLTN